jgi:hypothetical protein
MAPIKPSAFVIDRFGGLGSVYRETEVERTGFETIITDLMSGQFNDPIRVVAFNTLEHWSEGVSADIALEIQTVAAFKAPASPSISKTSLPTTQVRPAVGPTAGLIRSGEGGSGHDKNRLGRLDHPRSAAIEKRTARAE